MATPTLNESDEVHQPYVYVNNTQYATYCMATIECKHSILKIPTILDTGSSVSLIPYAYIKGRDIENQLISTDVKITGVSPGYSPIRGKIICNVTIGTDCIFHNICCYVTTHNNPCLIGNNVLRHESVVSFNHDNVNQCITIKRLVDNQRKSFKIEQFDRSHVTSQGVKFSGNSNSKTEWLKNNGIKFPDKSERLNRISNDDLGKITDLLMQYSEIIGDENNQGLYTEPVKIPTDGSSRSIPKNHVPQALEKSVTEEIQKMLEQGIIEPCDDPKGFNSPVYAVKKSDGSTRVVANFKSTLNQVLINPDPYPMPSMNTIFDKIGNGNRYFGTLDLLKGYWQVEIHSDDRHKTAFT